MASLNSVNSVLVDLDRLWTIVLNNPVLLWGFGPVVAYILGFICTAVPLELLIRTAWARSHFISYRKKGGDGGRWEALTNTWTKIPLSKQLAGTAWVVFGPTAIVNAIIGYFLFSYIMPAVDPSVKYPSSLLHAGVELCLLELVGDFFLYWGHRVQHEIPFLWKHFHHMHHTLDTPTPLGTLYIDSVDATLQGALPLLLTGIIVRPHPLMVLVYIYLRIAENVVNHSGLDSGLVNTIALKFLPFRASIGHHDSHHKFSNYAANAKNYGENFILWDYVFGTYRASTGL